jgi:hypothetical protein
LEKDLESVKKGIPHSMICRVCHDSQKIKVDLDSNPMIRTSQRSTIRRAKTKSRIWPRLFASSALLKGIMVDLSH